jgi:hypothetical protein
MSPTPPTSASSATRTEAKHRRRTATAVLAGEFDERPPRDILTSVLNGVPAYGLTDQRQSGGKRAGKQPKGLTGGKGADARSAPAVRSMAAVQPLRVPRAVRTSAGPSAVALGHPTTFPLPPRASSTSGPVAPSRPAIHMPSGQRSLSVTPPPPIMPPSSPMTTPGPSRCSSMGATSRTSSKRPRTPDDDEDITARGGPSASPMERQPRKIRSKVRKGWKGWVEGSPPPSDKLINLDTVTVIESRRTRSGRILEP